MKRKLKNLSSLLLIAAMAMLLAISCKARKQAEQHTAKQTTESSISERDSTGTSALKLQQIIDEQVEEVQYSKPDSAGAQYVERKVTTKRRTNTEANLVEESTVESMAQHSEQTSEESKTVERRKLSDKIGLIALVVDGLIAGLVIGLVVPYLLRLWRRR